MHAIATEANKFVTNPEQYMLRVYGREVSSEEIDAIELMKYRKIEIEYREQCNEFLEILKGINDVESARKACLILRDQLRQIDRYDELVAHFTKKFNTKK